MTTRLIMIIAVLISSLLTISQRVNAHEISQLRWLEPTIEQRLCEVSASGQEKDADNELVFITLLQLPTDYLVTPSKIFLNSSIAYHEQGILQPRAPPTSHI